MAEVTNWLSLDEAQAQIAKAATPLRDSEQVALALALGRVLAEDVRAKHNVPPWDNSGMDGYAVAIADCGASPLPVQGVITAGLSDIPPLTPGQCARIMTGAPVPAGADAVVMQENTDHTAEGIHILKTPTAGDNIRRRGSDVAQGELLIEAGTVLTAAHLMVLAAQGQATTSVFHKLRVGIVTTGDELVNPGDELNAGQIYDANRTGISALLASLPVVVTDYGIVKDDPEALNAVFTEAGQSQDLVISSGGVSVGDADFVKSVLAQQGAVSFWKVAIKPGKPFAFGTLGDTLFCGVPGNPVSAYVTTQMLVLPLIKRLCGDRDTSGYGRQQAVLAAAIKRRPGRLEFMRAYYQTDSENRLHVTPLARQSSAVMTSVTQANCYLQVDAESEQLREGDIVTILPFNQPGLS